ncbi:Tn3 family transposase [Streptosporangium canum]|uniref:Tn3 family transposase n=1 Tax=Streptosporangium canum TaxID=324952 RepID=UPI00342856F7
MGCRKACTGEPSGNSLKSPQSRLGCVDTLMIQDILAESVRPSMNTWSRTACRSKPVSANSCPISGNGMSWQEATARTYGTMIIVPTGREAHVGLDDFLGNATDLPIAEHATDGHGAAPINFALFDLVDRRLSRRTPEVMDPAILRTPLPRRRGRTGTPRRQGTGGSGSR